MGSTWAAVIAAIALVVGMSVTATPAHAEVDPPEGDPATATADALPTVQINGIVWDQEIVGNVVYVAGDFTSARPAGAALGTNETPRSHLLAYNLTTGVLITSFAPTINAQVRQVEASPDGTRLYIVGDFTSVNGVTRNHAAAFDLPGGTLSSFNPNANGWTGGVDATNTTVYLTGTFGRVGGQDRLGAAAVTRDGALLPWAPELGDRRGRVVVVSPDGAKVVLGGDFSTLNGSSNPGYGLGMVDATSGALLPFAANNVIRNAGNDAAILSLKTDGDSLYGVGYVFGAGGNLEGSFRASWETGGLTWVNDCHGDLYDVQPVGEVIYAAGHPHYCGSLVGGFPQSDPWTFYRAVAMTKEVERITPGGLNLGYHDFGGNPAPKLLHWFPTFNAGTVSGHTQGPWSVTGNSDYVVYGGEFTRVNYTNQQGLVRFAVSSKAPNAQGPVLWNTDWMPSATAVADGSLRITWPSNWDRDSEFLKYEVLRDNVVIKTFDALRSKTADWAIPPFSYVDTDVVSDTSYTYRIRATDERGNTILGGTVTASASGSATASSYRGAVLADLPRSYWPLDEASGATAYDWAGGSDLTLAGGYTRGQSSAIVSESDRPSTRFNGTSGTSSSANRILAPQTFSIEAWVRTQTNGGAGGKIVGFGDKKTGLSSSYDRHVYMENNGRISFGVYPGSERTITSSAAYNDGQWHHIVAGLDSTGMVLYVDGVRVAQRTDTIGAQYYYGYWRVGGDRTWAGNNYFRGDIDEVAIYDGSLSRQTVQTHYTASGRSLPGSTAPADAYGEAVYDLEPSLYWRMDEATGTFAADYSGMGQRGRYLSGHTKGQAGPLTGVTDTAVRFTGGQLVSENSYVDPRTYSVEAWFNTTTTAGGKIIGFGSSNSTTNSANYDRHVFMTNTGQVVYGVWAGSEARITTPSSYNDGSWHHVVATQGSEGMRLYIDGQLIGSNATADAQAYTGYWHVGGDVSWGPGGNPFAGVIDEVAVYPAPMSAADVALHHALGSTGQVPNTVPTASFTSLSNKLALDVDASASVDPDGTIAGYSWNWGDGTPASTGVTASHTYAEAGTYTVTLTVTDNDNATGVVTTVVSPVANQAPAASFTATTLDLVADVNAGASSDADGTISSYSWSWGDGSPAGTGATASHAYAASGTYTITLTVTDNDGATAQTTQSVNASAPVGAVTYARDAFNRNAATGLGSADVGGAWTLLQSAANYRVNGSAAEFIQPAGGNQRYAYLTGVSTTDAALEADITLPQRPVGGSSFSTMHVRRIGAEQYFSRVIVAANGGVTVQLMRTDSVLTNTTTSLNVTAGDTLRTRTEATGTSPTTLRVKVWKSGTPEPSTWNSTITDSTTALQAPGHVGLGVYLGGAVTSVPFITRFDNLWVGSTTGTGVQPPTNADPTASFTATPTDLTVAVNGSASSDPDGTIASHSWNWGDGTPAGSGATASHAYAAAGAYTITLTVTDNAGATATTTRPVTVTAPGGPGNQDPTASFTATPTDLTVAVNGSASSDPDGTIASHSWNWGDGTPAGSGATASHAYAAAGAYTITLTVTDNAGATATTTRPVTVTAPAGPVVFAQDNFERAAGTLGAAQLGGTWTQTAGAANVGIEGGTARLTTLAASQTRTASLNTATSDSTDLTTSFRLSALPGSARMYVSALGRVVGSQDYRARWLIEPDGSVEAQLSRGGTVLQWVSLTSPAIVPGTEYNVRLQVFGTGTTTLRSKIWVDGTPEPATWQLSTTDSTPALQTAGHIGVSTYSGGGFTVVPFNVFFDDFQAKKVTP